MPYNLLLLPLLGGFIFACLWHPTRYYARRNDSYRLLFLSSITGAFLLGIAGIVTLLFFGGDPQHGNHNYLPKLLHSVIPFPHSGKAVLAFLLGALMWIPLNFLGKLPFFKRYLSKEACLNRAINEKDDPLEITLKHALEDENRLVLVTLGNGKVYVGNVTKNLNPAYELKTIRLLVAFSGYRDDDTKRVILNFDYAQARNERKKQFIEAGLKEEIKNLNSRGRYWQYLVTWYLKGIKNPKESLLFEDFYKKILETLDEKFASEQFFQNVIPVSEIKTVTRFDVDIYKAQEASQTKKDDTQSKTEQTISVICHCCCCQKQSDTSPTHKATST